MNYKDKNKKYKKPFNRSERGGEEKYDHIEPLQSRPLEVKVYDNFERALRAFRALVQKERVLSTYKEKQRYEKPSDKKRRKRNERKRKMFELEMKEKSPRKIKEKEVFEKDKNE